MTHTNLKTGLLGAVAGAILFGSSLQSAHSTLTFDFNTIWTSSGTPGGTAPWATLTITDIVGGVTMTLTHNSSSAAGQYLSTLNLLAAPLPNNINASHSSSYIQGISFGNYVDAGLGFNIKIDFKNGPPSARLNPGLSSTWDLFGTGLSEANFGLSNTSQMVHLQGIAGGGSAKIIVPEPASLIALGTGIASLLGLRCRKSIA